METLDAKVEEHRVRVEVPGFKTWGLVVLGETLFPSAELRLKSRNRVPVASPLDKAFTPGGEIEVEARVENAAPTGCSISLHVPEGWKYEEAGREGNIIIFRVIPLFAEKDKGYAITPVVTKDGESMPSWPLILQAKDPAVLQDYHADRGVAPRQG